MVSYRDRMMADRRAVVGWLAMTLQSSGPLSSLPVEYMVPDTGVIALRWRGGPTAQQVAAKLRELADPDMPVTDPPFVAPHGPITAVAVGGVTVTLHAFDPEPDRRPPHVAEPRLEWPWDFTPIRHGVTFDSVLWQQPAESDADVALVLSAPAVAMSDGWRMERGWLVANLDYDPPPHASGETKKLWQRSKTLADIRLRHQPGWGFEQADEWLSAQRRTASMEPATANAVLLLDRCVMRLSGLGLRIDITRSGDGLPSPLWPVVPAAVVEAANRAGAGGLPETIRVRRWGNPYTETEFQLGVDLVSPWRQERI